MNALTSLQGALLGYGAIFICVGLGLLFLRRAAGGRIGVGFWSASFFLNAAGFLVWARIATANPWLYFAAGDVLHVSGFLMLLMGVVRFTGRRFRLWNLPALVAFAGVWGAAIALMIERHAIAIFLFSALRTLLFVPAGVMILRLSPGQPLVGRRLAGWSSLAWGVYVLLMPVVPRLPIEFPLAFGFLLGFQVLIALGLVILVVDRIRMHAEEVAHHAERLEGLLPICSYCKRIRDEDGNWQSVESYVANHSKAGFSHGICPECVKAHFPELDLKRETT